MHFSQIDHKSTPKGKILICFYLFINENTGIYFCSKCGKCRILNNLTNNTTFLQYQSLLRHSPYAIYPANGKNPREAKPAQLYVFQHPTQ